MATPLAVIRGSCPSQRCAQQVAKPFAQGLRHSHPSSKIAPALLGTAVNVAIRSREVSRNISCQAGGTTIERGAPATEWIQKTISLPSMSRGCHIVTRHIVRELEELHTIEVGMANFFIQHTSASLTINENASPDVPLDLNDTLDRIVPEGHHYRHLDEGLDDMPAHVKSSLMGPSLNIPIQQGRLALGTWQGIYLNEHRNYGGSRRIVVTLQGKLRADGRKYGSNAW
ncbi:hypothetical protein CVIRNUC_011114 [Coccomyxa viridis]|uniref:Secondary thiamine-phosphate synthase enzyme n=1 Tax=Coccomyxa viridis TaxID=1274662 RepID=A0AAV1IKU4_9CHLO|nr:hypothetical protein CVIRNUC_011114 [Coccomyxa viridis]